MAREGNAESRGGRAASNPLSMLTPEQIREVDRALANVGPFGEVRLIKVKGKLRFIQQLDSRDLLRGDGPAGRD